MYKLDNTTCSSMQLTCGRWYLPNKDPVQCRYLRRDGGGGDDGGGGEDGGEDDGEDDDGGGEDGGGGDGEDDGDDAAKENYFRLVLQERRQVPHQGRRFKTESVSIVKL